MKHLKAFENVIFVSLTAMTALVVLLATVELGWIILRDIVSPPISPP